MLRPAALTKRLLLPLLLPLLLAGAALLPACDTSAAPDRTILDAADARAADPLDAATTPADQNPVLPDLAMGPDAAGDPLAAWALYTLAPGAHSATLAAGAANNPLSVLVSNKGGRDFQFVLDPSAVYTIVQPVEPNDQLDWNKLPGLSDCNQFDLSVNGMMFAWRWRLDLNPQVLEITAYANNASKHLWPADPLFTLDAADLASRTPLHYRMSMQGDHYGFSVDGTIRGRPISVKSTLPRQCPAMTPAQLVFQWAAGFYFGGTSTAPSLVTGRISEVPFK